jgi:diphosphomevalonate decarboxylase
MATAVARAHPNIAFIKYWGNRDNALKIPSNGSLSMNLDGLFTETSVTWHEGEGQDSLLLNGKEAEEAALVRVQRHLNMLRERLGVRGRGEVISVNNFPMGVGIASSAASFAALTVSAVRAMGISLDERELTRLARIGSGSASRSVPTGFVEWLAGDDHMSSYAYSFAEPSHWDLVDVVAVVSDAHKKVGSEDGHKTAETSDLQEARVAGADARIRACKRAIEDRDFASFAEVVEMDSNLMHAVMMTSRPPLFYWQAATMTVMQAVRELRQDGLSVCYTLDAGPNVHCLCLSKDMAQVQTALARLDGVRDLRMASVGMGAQVLDVSE